MRGFRDSERGAAAVEFALVFPVLIVMIFGIIEFGAVFNAQIMVTAAAREGVRELVVTGDETAARDVAEAAAIGLDLSDADFDFSAPSCDPGATVELTITWNRPLLTGLFGASTAISGQAARACGG